MRARLALTDLHDVEETIWSPTYGLKGVVDASMQARIVEEDGIRREERSWTLPLEIKTGRSSAALEHRAQTMLYTLLMSERYGMSSISSVSLVIEHQYHYLSKAFKYLQDSYTTLNPKKLFGYLHLGTSLEDCLLDGTSWLPT